MFRGLLYGKAYSDYRVTPQALVALRMIFGNKASLDVTAREYLVTNAAGITAGHDDIIRTDLAFTWRIARQHAVSIRYLWKRRDATYATLSDTTQSRATSSKPGRRSRHRPRRRVARARTRGRDHRNRQPAMSCHRNRGS